MNVFKKLLLLSIMIFGSSQLLGMEDPRGKSTSSLQEPRSVQRLNNLCANAIIQHQLLTENCIKQNKLPLEVIQLLLKQWMVKEKIYNLEELLVSYPSHKNSITSVGCVDTRSGPRIVSGSYDKTIQICDLEGKQVATCVGHTDGVTSVCVIHTPKPRIVSGSGDGTVRIWNLKGVQKGFCQGHAERVTSVSVVNTLKPRIVSGSDDGTVRIWNLKGTQKAVCQGHTDKVTSVSVAEDCIVSGSWDGTVRFWDFNGKQVAVNDDDRERIVSVSAVCKPESSEIVSSDWKGTLRLWDLTGIKKAESSNHKEKIASMSVEYTPDGLRVIGNRDGKGYIWDFDGNQIAVCQASIKPVTAVSSVYTHAGLRFLILGCWDGKVHVWDPEYLLKKFGTISSEQALEVLRIVKNKDPKETKYQTIKNVLDKGNNSK